MKKRIFKLTKDDVKMKRFIRDEEFNTYKTTIEPNLNSLLVHPFGKSGKFLHSVGIKDIVADYKYISNTMMIFCILFENAVEDKELSIANKNNEYLYLNLYDKWCIIEGEYNEFMGRYDILEIIQHENSVESNPKLKLSYMYDLISNYTKGANYFINPTKYEVPWSDKGVSIIGKLMLQKTEIFSSRIINDRTFTISEMMDFMLFRIYAKFMVEAVYIQTKDKAKSVKTAKDFEEYIILNNLKICCMNALKTLDCVYSAVSSEIYPYKSEIVPEFKRDDNYDAYTKDLSPEGKDMLKEMISAIEKDHPDIRVFDAAKCIIKLVEHLKKNKENK